MHVFYSAPGDGRQSNQGLYVLMLSYLPYTYGPYTEIVTFTHVEGLDDGMGPDSIRWESGFWGWSIRI